MPKTERTPDSVRELVVQYKKDNPTAGSREIGKKFGMHHKTVSRILRQAGFSKYGGAWITPEEVEEIQEEIRGDGPAESSEVKGDTWTISLPKTRIKTLEELLEYCQVDTSLWEVERFICNKWEMGYKDKHDKGQVMPLFQVKAFLRKRKDVEAVKKEIDALKRAALDYAPLPAPIIRKTVNSGLMLEVNIPDTHFGKLAWAVETGWKNYDLKIATSIFRTALATLLERVKGYEFEQVLFVVGNDLLNADNSENQTTRGTQVTTDARYHKTFKTVRILMTEAIEDLRRIAPVKVVMVRGNHDGQSVWHLGDSLECWFNKYEDVEIDNLPRERKYHQFGQCMLMFTHGHLGKHSDYPMKMAVEQPEMFGATKFRECHTGHKHKKQSDLVTMRDIDENHGVRVRILSALCPPDDWHAENGYIGNLRSAELMIWSKNEGLIGTAVYTDVD